MAQPLTPPSADRPPAPEREIVFDMARRALPVAPVLVALAALVWGADGAYSAAFGIGLVLVNLVLSGLALAFASRFGPNALMATALGGFLLRMGLLVLAVAAVRDQSWVAIVPLGITIVITHLGLLFWETRHVSASLAYPALKPRRS